MNKLLKKLLLEIIIKTYMIEKSYLERHIKKMNLKIYEF